MSLSMFTKLITTSRGIKASGYNYETQLDGAGTADEEIDIVQPTVSNVYKMDRSTYHTVYILSDGRVFGAGYNGQGQLGLGTTTSVKLEEIKSVTKKVKEVVCGGYHTFFLMKNGDVYCTGLNNCGQLGLGDTNNRNTPTKITSLSNIKKIYCGGYHTFFQNDKGEIYACGYNIYGQLGLGTLNESVVTPQKLSISEINSVKCGESFTYFIMNDGSIKSCGYNGYGELLRNNLDNSEIVGNITLNSNISFNDIALIECGSHHSLFLTNNGDVYGCGSNEYGQLGLGETTTDTKGSMIKLNITKVANLYATAYSSLFQLDTMNIYGCGNNEYGELGLGDTINRYSIVKLLYTEIWLDSLAEEIIIIPPLDNKKNIYIVDGLFMTSTGKYIGIMDKDYIFKVYNSENMQLYDTIYFYIEANKISYTRTYSQVFNNDGTRKFTMDSHWESCTVPFIENLSALIFSINNTIYSYNPSKKSLSHKDFTSKEIVTSIEVTKVSNNNCNLIVATENNFVSGTLTISSGSFSVNSLSAVSSHLNRVYDLRVIKMNNSTYYFGFKGHFIYFSKLNNGNYTNYKYDFGERITASFYYNERLFLGTRSGCLYVITNLDLFTSSSYKAGVYRKFKGEISSLKIKETKNELTRSLIIDENSRYLLIGFTDGKYRKFPLYKIPKITFTCEDLNFIDGKIYYHIKLKLYDYDSLFYNNMKFIIHNTYNEVPYTISDLDKNFEMNTTIEFESLDTTIYSYIRLNYIYGNNSLGSIYCKMGVIKENLFYVYNKKFIGNFSNYSEYPCLLQLNAIKIDADNNITESVEIGTCNLSNSVDHQMISFLDTNNLFATKYTHFNIIAKTNKASFIVHNNDLISNIRYSNLIKELRYNGGILSDMEIIFNKIYENKNLNDISLDKILSLLNLLSRKKLDNLTPTDNELLSSDICNDVYGNTLDFLNNDKKHYRNISNPEKVQLREHYRSNIFINGMKVSFEDTYNQIDMENNIFSTYYLDENIQRQAKNYTNTAIYKESLALDEKELWSYTIKNEENDIRQLISVDGMDVYITSYDDSLDESYLSIYIQFAHTVFKSRINVSEYKLTIVERNDSYVRMKLKLNNQVLLKVGNIIHICVNDIDKKNTIIFKDVDSSHSNVYYNYFTPLVYVNEVGTMYTYYTDKSENIEVYVNGFMLTPYVDYKVVNLPLHLKVPTLVLFRNPIKNNQKIEISILKENFLDCMIRENKDNSNISITGIHNGTNFIPLQQNLYDLYLDGIKIPRLEENGKEINLTNFKGKYKWSYVRFYLEDNQLTRFLVTLYKQKILQGSSPSRPKDNGSLTQNEFEKNITLSKIDNIYQNSNIDGRIFLIIESIDKSFNNRENAIIDCNDTKQISFNGSIPLNGNSEFNLPYIEKDLQIDSNHAIDVNEDFINTIN